MLLLVPHSIAATTQHLVAVAAARQPIPLAVSLVQSEPQRTVGERLENTSAKATSLKDTAAPAVHQQTDYATPPKPKHEQSPLLLQHIMQQAAATREPRAGSKDPT